MSHHGEIGEITAPHSKFYQGPYGRMFRNLPPHVPTLDLIEWMFIEGLSESTAEKIKEILMESRSKFYEGLESILKERDEIEISETESRILIEIKKTLQDTETERNTILKPLLEIWLSIKDLPEPITEKIKEFLAKTEQQPENNQTISTEKKEKIRKVLEERGNQEEIEEVEITILSEIREALQESETSREAILKLLARTMIEPKEQFSDPTGIRDNPDIPAGYTYFSQYITHDITFDPTSSLMRFNDPNKLRNFRTPRLDLDSLYGGGPDDSPFMYDYDPADSDKKYYLLVGKGANTNNKEEDLPRNRLPDHQARALIGDMRNDQTIMISQLHLAFVKFHNAIMKWLKNNQGLTDKSAFSEAQRLVRWHYQWVILHDFLPKFVDQEILDKILYLSDCSGQPKLCYYQWRTQPFIPVEFSVAAFRFGHSMIRNQYSLNYSTKTVKLITDSENQDLINFSRLKPTWTIQWDFFFNNHSNPDLQNSRLIDTQLSYFLGELPPQLDGGKEHLSLATRDLLRGYKMDLPSGQAVARAMGVRPLDGKEEPLWYYILREAKELRGGRKLGPVGGRIVAEVIIGLLAGNPHSFFNVEPGWQPVLPRHNESQFELLDILRFAEMPLTKHDLEEKFAQ